MSGSSLLRLSFSEDLRLARQLLRPQLPHDIHNMYLKESVRPWTVSMFSRWLPTGDGRAGHFYGYILLLRSLHESSMSTSEEEAPSGSCNGDCVSNERIGRGNGTWLRSGCMQLSC